MLEVAGWPGHLAGQHVDLRLTAPDGYQAVRSYSLAAPAAGDRIELTVQRVRGGEVSAYLTDGFAVGDAVELRGPAGAWFVWRPADPGPVLLVAGGAGIVPLMAMIRARRGRQTPFRLIYSVREPAEVFYPGELLQAPPVDRGLEAAFVYTRSAPPGFARAPARLAAADVADGGWPAAAEPSCFVCGPTGFVERAADLLVELGHDPRRVKTERFGPTGGAT
ncbi:oxidoreductase [Pengzhenrongella sicca]|uniref:Oxidoreductase n=1 Tax=Pengzhenrongella sicca TaxID=2819238 RepID=A0A8A4ZLM5_9MICO|nr:oxidoreductase [Pengzhenrongella sicca]